MAALTETIAIASAYWPLLLLLGFGGYTIYQVYFHPLRDIPGPFLAKLTRWWQAYEVWAGAAEKTEIALHEKYGKYKCFFSLARMNDNTASRIKC
jgi:hypothetical protein